MGPLVAEPGAESGEGGVAVLLLVGMWRRAPAADEPRWDGPIGDWRKWSKSGLICASSMRCKSGLKSGPSL
jgi:hypothetical protein